MSGLKSLIALAPRNAENLEAAGLKLTGSALAGSLGLLAFVLLIELPLLAWVYHGLLASGISSLALGLLLSVRLAGIYGVIHIGRLRPLCALTWLNTPARMLSDIWWPWLLGAIPIAALTLFMLLADDFHTEDNTTALVLVSTVLVWFTFLTAAPPWLWAAARGAMVFNRIQSVAANRYGR